MSRIGIALSLVLIVGAAGCKKNGCDSCAVQTQEQNFLKPVVAIVPVIDRTINDIPWNLSDELTSSLYQRIAQKDRLYLVDLQKVQTASKKLGNGNNPFGTNIAWTKKAFRENEFVVFLELLEHEEVAIKGSSLENSSAELNTSIRLRVLDLRGKEPTVVLQELIHDQQFIPKQFTKSNFNQVPWGKEGFDISPLGLAHEQLTKEISSRLEDYIVHAMNSSVR